MGDKINFKSYVQEKEILISSNNAKIGRISEYLQIVFLVFKVF